MKNLVKKLKSKALVISTTISALMLSGASVYADDQFQNASEQAAIAFGTAKQKESAKERVPAILIGVAIILGATSYAGIIFGWFHR